MRASRRMDAGTRSRPSFETLASQAPQDEVSNLFHGPRRRGVTRGTGLSRSCKTAQPTRGRTALGKYRVTVDTGGTFSDFVCLDEDTGAISITKVPATPDDPSRAILHGIEMLLAGGIPAEDIALLLPWHHRRHQRAAGGQRRQDRAPGDGRFPRHLRGRRAGAALRRRDLRRHVRQAAHAGAAAACTGEVRERVDFRGEVLLPLDEAALRDDPAGDWRAENPESIAVCLLVLVPAPAARGARRRHHRRGTARMQRLAVIARCCRRSASTTG